MQHGEMCKQDRKPTHTELQRPGNGPETDQSMAHRCEGPDAEGDGVTDLRSHPVNERTGNQQSDRIGRGENRDDAGKLNLGEADAMH